MTEKIDKVFDTTKVIRNIQMAVSQGKTIVSAQGSSRSAKTFSITMWLIWTCIAVPGTSVSICRATLPALKGSVLRDFIDILSGTGNYNVDWFNKSDLVYTFPNGSWVEFFSCDNEQKLRGRKRKILFVNEANELRYMEWQQLQMRTTELTILDYNPSFSDEHWICEVNKDPRTYHFITTYKDNPFLEQKVIDEIESLRDKNPSLWQIYGLGQQAQIEGLVFPHIDIVDDVPTVARQRDFIGMDFGYTHDPTAIVHVRHDTETETIYIDELCYRTQMVASDIIHVLKSSPRYRVISESADPRLVDEIHRAGIDIHPVKKFQGSIEAGINKMLELRVCVTRRSANVIKEFRNYTWSQDKNGAWLNRPIDMYNHAIDAARYVVLETILGAQRRMDIDRLARAFGR